MLNRRHFIATTAAAVAAAPAFAQTAATTGPLQLDVAPEALNFDPDNIVLPPDFDGSFPIPERFRARIVPVQSGLPVNSIHIVPQSYNLYFVLPGNRAIRYGVAIGQEGLYWRGQATIARKVEWPSWRPTDEMIERNPTAYAKYADGMPGGPENPLGARALYFFQSDVDTAIRVHGTILPASIGSSASNGCFRMYNSHVIDLYNRVPLGALAYAY
jgi:lipoprotein-anchoring transpeptidase ErfK/SrfK